MVKWITIDKGGLNSQSFIEAKDEFLTKPPCQYLHVYKLGVYEDGTARHAEGGFKISDLLDLGRKENEKLIQDAERDNTDPSYSLLCGYMLTLHLKEDTTEVTWWKQSKPAEEILDGQETET